MTYIVAAMEFELDLEDSDPRNMVFSDHLSLAQGLAQNLSGAVRRIQFLQKSTGSYTFFARPKGLAQKVDLCRDKSLSERGR